MVCGERLSDMPCGSVGLTAVGDSHAEAESFYKKAVAALDEEAAAAMAPRSLPSV